MRMWCEHLGQTLRLRSSSARYSTASQAGHLIHSPSGTERERRSVLMREGTIFSNHDTASAFGHFGQADHSGIIRQAELRGVVDPPEVQPLGRCSRFAGATLAGFELLG